MYPCDILKGKFLQIHMMKCAVRFYAWVDLRIRICVVCCVGVCM